MNYKRFTARNSRDALKLVREAFGDDAVVLSTKPCAEGVEVLAMAPEGMAQIEQISAAAPRVSAPSAPRQAPAVAAATPARRVEPVMAAPAAEQAPVDEDVRRLSMSTLSFQDFVRERMLKRRQEALSEVSRFPDDAILPLVGTHQTTPTVPAQPVVQAVSRPVERAADRVVDRVAERGHGLGQRMSAAQQPTASKAAAAVSALQATQLEAAPQIEVRREAPVQVAQQVQQQPQAQAQQPGAVSAALRAARAETQNNAHEDMMRELRHVKGLIEDRFGALAYMERLQRQPAQARMTQKLIDCGFSAALIRKLSDALPQDIGDENAWITHVLERNLLTGEADGAIEDQGGVFALIGATGVGKTTSTAKLAAAFAAKHGANNLGLITLDAYRVGAHEQLRAYGRILGVPVHTAHDRASLEDLLELLAGKKMVLIDTAGMAQRDTRTRELLEMLQHPSIQRLLVINASAQGETIEDVLFAYRAASCCGVVLSKIDEAVKLGPAVDALIRHKLKVVGVANGQRVPEDWHRLSANALIHRALRGGGSNAYRYDTSDINLIFTTPRAGALSAAALHA